MQKTKPHSSKVPESLALLAVVATIVLHLISQADGPNVYFIAGATSFWILFVAWHFVFDRSTIEKWGFRLEGLKASAFACWVIFVAIAILFAFYAWLNDQLSFPATTSLLLIIYPIYGLIQQFLALAIVWRGLEKYCKNKSHRLVAALGTSLLFGMIHLPDLGIMFATALLEIVMIAIYFRWNNLWPLGFLHGWTGAFYFLWIEGRDMWGENIQPFL